MRYDACVGSIEASDEHLVGNPIGVIQARVVVGLPDKQTFDAKAGDEMQGTSWPPSTKHQRINVRTHKNEDDDQGDEDDEEVKEMLMGMYDEEDSEETAEDKVRKQNIIFSRIG